MDKGTEETVVDIVHNEVIHLKKGYMIVRCRGQKEITDKVSLSEATEKEIAFFRDHAHFQWVPSPRARSNMFSCQCCAEHLIPSAELCMKMARPPFRSWLRNSHLSWCTTLRLLLSARCLIHYNEWDYCWSHHHYLCYSFLEISASTGRADWGEASSNTQRTGDIWRWSSTWSSWESHVSHGCELTLRNMNLNKNCVGTKNLNAVKCAAETDSVHSWCHQPDHRRGPRLWRKY